MFALTKTDSIPDNYQKYHIHNNLLISNRIRSHLVQRFPDCHWEVTNNDIYINVSLKSSPWEKNSKIVHAIADYSYYYVDSYNYDHTDINSDYCNMNFFGVYKNNIIAKDYTQLGATSKTQQMELEFMRQYNEAFTNE